MEHHPDAAPSRSALTEAALCAWVGRAHPGDRFVYHQGFLSIDTAAESRFGTLPERKALRLVADRAWQLAQDGVIHLVQRRDGPGEYTYVVVVCPRPRAAGGALRTVLQRAGFCRQSSAE